MQPPTRSSPGPHSPLHTRQSVGWMLLRVLRGACMSQENTLLSVERQRALRRATATERGGEGGFWAYLPVQYEAPVLFGAGAEPGHEQEVQEMSPLYCVPVQ